MTFLAAYAAAAAQTPGTLIYRNPKARLEARVRSPLSRMTLEEKAAQMSFIWVGVGAILGEDGAFSGAKAAERLANGVGQMGRPSDSQGNSQSTTQSLRSPKTSPRWSTTSSAS